MDSGTDVAVSAPRVRAAVCPGLIVMKTAFESP